MADLTPDAEGKANMSVADVQDIVKQAIGFQQGRDEIKEYWREKNVTSIDGLPTGMREVLGEAVE